LIDTQSSRVAVDVVTSAFFDDPVERWLWPDDETYQREFPTFVDALGGKAFHERTVWSSDGGDAVALWLPPGVTADDEAIVDVLSATVAPAKHPDMFAGLEQMDAAHPREPHWYLPWLAVHRDSQGHGHGHRLLTDCLEMVDAAHQAAYLETPNPRTIPFYERHGFRNIGHTHAGSCPPITFMMRPAH
jgi:GNAT superfamily N-acetyltransferase